MARFQVISAPYLGKEDRSFARHVYTLGASVWGVRRGDGPSWPWGAMADSSDSKKVEAAPEGRPKGSFPRAFGNYLLLQRLARGGMGEVYIAKSGGIAGIEKHCVVKTLRPHFTSDREYVTRFIDEARVVVQLAHRNIAQIFDVGRVNKQYYLAMEFIVGTDLRTIAERAQAQGLQLPENVALHIISEMLEALDYAHRHVDPSTGQKLNLVHRDVSPQNVMVSFEGEVKLIDFGLAHSTMKVEQTQPNVVMGKMAYMSPEQARGDELDGRADLFAAAVLCYELLVGERYYEGLSFDQIWSIAGTGGYRPRKWDQLHPELVAVLARALEAKPDDRFPTGADFKDALLEYSVSQRLRPVSRELRQLMSELFGDESTKHYELIARFQNVSAINSMANPAAKKEESQSFAVRNVESFIDGAPIPDRATGSEVIPFQQPGDRTEVQSADPTAVAPADLTDRYLSTNPPDRTEESSPIPEMPTLIQSGSDSGIVPAEGAHPDAALLIDRSDRRPSDPQDATYVVRDSRGIHAAAEGQDTAQLVAAAGLPPSNTNKWIAILAGVTLSLTGVAAALFFFLGEAPAPGSAGAVGVAHNPPADDAPAAADTDATDDATSREAAADDDDDVVAPDDKSPPGADTDTPSAQADDAPEPGPDAIVQADENDSTAGGESDEDEGNVAEASADDKDDDKADRRKRRRARRTSPKKTSTRRVAAAEPAPEPVRPKLSPAGQAAYTTDGVKVWDFLKDHCKPIVPCAKQLHKPNIREMPLTEVKKLKELAASCAKRCKRVGS